MNAIEIYLVFALISWIIFFVSAYKKTWGTLFGSFFFAIAWPTAHVINYLMWRQSSRCAWCGKESKRDDITIRQHILECEKHPMRAEFVRLRKARLEARSALKRIINLQACDYSAEEFKKLALDDACAAVRKMDGEQ